MRSFYLILDIVPLIIALFFSFRPRAYFRKDWKWLLPSIAAVAIPTLVLNIQFIRAGIWNYDPDFCLGYSIAGLPVEETLYYLFIPYFAMLCYYFCRYYLPGTQLKYTSRIIAGVVSALCLIIAVVNYDHWFTVISFLLASIFLTVCFLQKPFWLGHLVIICGFFGLCFLLVNGIYQEAGVSFPLFRYDTGETMGIFLNNFPIECLAYNFTGLGCIISIYEKFKAS